MSLDMMRQMLVMFKGITRDVMADTANYKLALLLCNEMADKLNVTRGYAAEIVGKMEIKVNNVAYSTDPELFHDIAREMVRIMSDALTLYTIELGHSAAHSMVKEMASRMSLTYD